MSHLDKIIRIADAVNNRVGQAIAWLTLALVLAQFVIVILRYVFSIGFISMQESVLYLYGIIFMAGAGYTLLHDGHVRVDIFYREAGPYRQALINLLGGLFLLLPICVATFLLSYGYVINSWSVFEGSVETSGLPAIFLLKSVIWVFAGLLGLQGVAMMLQSLKTVLGKFVEHPVDRR